MTTTIFIFLCCMFAFTTGVPVFPKAHIPIEIYKITLKKMSAREHSNAEENWQGFALWPLFKVREAVVIPNEPPSKPWDPRGLIGENPIRISYPGTKWCGPGNTARNYLDLGHLANEDRCCREHDYCPETLVHGQCLHGICNEFPYATSHCTCDEHFRQCLQSLNSPAADAIGSLFYNVAGIKCFAEYENNDMSVAKSKSAHLLTDHVQSERGPLEMWTTSTEGEEQQHHWPYIGCSGKPNCWYKFYRPKMYTKTATNNGILPTYGQRSLQQDV